MANVVRMPGISADADSAILVEWALAVGAEVRKGDVIATVETDKAVVDIEAEADGTLERTFAGAGDTVDIGGPMALLLAAGEGADDVPRILAELGLAAPGEPAAAEAAAPAEAPDRTATPFDAGEEERSADDVALGATPGVPHTADQLVGAGTNGSTGDHATHGGRLFATPLVRRLAAETGVPLTVLRGSGPNGRIRRRDLEAHQTALAAAPQPSAPQPARTSSPSEVTAPTPSAPASSAPAPVAAATTGDGWTDEPASRFRKAVAKGLTASKQNVPHFYLKTTCRFDAVLALRAQVNATGTTKITINDFVVKAAAAALRAVPEMNVSWTGDAVRHFHAVDVGVAMTTERGLVVPVLRSVDTRSLSAVSASVKDFSARAAANTLQQHEMEGGSLTISNLGMYGVEEFTAIINPPQAAILAVGATVPRALEGADGGIELVPCVTFVLSVDHRPVDGALAARWLQTFKNLIENPLAIVV